MDWGRAQNWPLPGNLYLISKIAFSRVTMNDMLLEMGQIEPRPSEVKGMFSTKDVDRQLNREVTE